MRAMGYREAVEARTREGYSRSFSPSPEYRRAVEQKIRPPITEAEKIALAHEVRAEGHIYHKAYLTKRREYQACFYGLRIEFTDIEKEVAEFVHKLFSKYGRVHLRWVEGVGAWRVSIEGVLAKKVLADVLPYLVGIKREAAEMALEYLAYIHCVEGRPPLPRAGRPPQVEHTPSGRVWADFFKTYGRRPTLQEWEAIKPR